MGMIIRVVFNNQNWMGKCKNANADRRLFKCQKLTINIGHGRFETDNDGNCKSTCTEEALCTKYLWESYQGNFNKTKATGNVFFVFSDTNNSLVLFAKSRVEKVEGNKIYFEEFKPMPQKEWVKGIHAKEIFGVNWGRGTYRYLNDKQEEYLEKMIREVKDNVTSII